MKLRLTALTLLVPIVLASCGRSLKKTDSGNSVADSSFIEDFRNHISVFHAKGFSVDNYDSYKRLVILDPVSKDTITSYFLVPKGRQIPTEITDSSLVIRVPVSRVAVMSTTYLGAFNLLGADSLVVAAADCRYINNPVAVRLVKEHKIVDLGSSMEPNVEILASSNPDILLISDMTKGSEKPYFGNTKIRQVLENDWKETSLLGRAEWLKVIGMLTGKVCLSEDLFNQICDRYETVCREAAGADKKVSVLFGTDYKGQWYMPGKESYVGGMFKDLSATFDTPVEGNGSQPLSFETVISRFKSSGKWFSLGVMGVQNLSDLKKNNPRYALFDAFKNGEVYMADKKVNPNGGNDFFESGVYAPDVVLKDVASILYPSLYPGYVTIYWRKLPR